jgi:hypothetical protein
MVMKNKSCEGGEDDVVEEPLVVSLGKQKAPLLCLPDALI